MARIFIVNKPLKAVFGVLWLLFAIFLVILTWDWAVVIIEALEDDFVKVMFWIGYFGLFIIYGLYVPYHIIASVENE